MGQIVLHIGLAGLLIAAGWAAETRNFQASAQRIPGTVTGVEHWQSNRTAKAVYTVEYRAGGKKHSIRSSLNGAQVSYGAVVPLLVLASNPSDARLPDDLWSNKIGVAVLGMIFVLVGLVLGPLPKLFARPAA